MEANLNEMKDYLIEKIENKCCLKCFEMWTLITKALVLREHHLSTTFSLKVQSYLNSINISDFKLKFRSMSLANVY